MNELEKLTSNNKENYELYLNRMTNSMNKSTKGIIPYLAKDGNNILDVGCGSGVMLKSLEKENSKAKLTGIDLNIEAINKLKLLNNNWKLYHVDFMSLNNMKYDTIIFSSILHEISSYHRDLNKRFTSIPIKEAFNKTNELLVNNGSIILRDGLLVDKEKMNNLLIISFTNPVDSYWLYRFKNDFEGFNTVDIDNRIRKVDNNKYIVSERFLKEFLYTYTWGEESYYREINERFGILTKDEWINLLYETGFTIDFITLACEEYEKYLSKKIIITDLDGNKYNYPFMTILIKGRKNKCLVK